MVLLSKNDWLKSCARAGQEQSCEVRAHKSGDALKRNSSLAAHTYLLLLPPDKPNIAQVFLEA